jgi:hypothetical protein
MGGKQLDLALKKVMLCISISLLKVISKLFAFPDSSFEPFYRIVCYRFLRFMAFFGELVSPTPMSYPENYLPIRSFLSMTLYCTEPLSFYGS